MTQGGLNVVLQTGATSILLRDALRRPLAEIELGEVDASLRRIDSHVMRVSVGESPANLNWVLVYALHSYIVAHFWAVASE